MPEDKSQQGRHHSSRIKLPMTGGIILALIAIIGYWYYEANKVPLISIPTPKMPNPNAFDTFVKAGSLLQDEKSIDYAFATKHSSGIKEDREYTLAEMDKILVDNKETFSVLRKGFGEEYRNPPARSFAALFPYYARFRALARALAFEAEVKEKHGDWTGAMDSRLDVMELGAKIPHGSVLIGELVGIACQAIGRKQMWDSLEHLDANQAKLAVKRLEKIDSECVSMADTLTEEKYSIQASLIEVFRNSNTTQLLNAGQGPNATPAPPQLATLFFLLYSKRRIMSDLTKYYDNVIEVSRQPYANHAPEPKIPNDPLVQILAPVFEQATFKGITNSTQNRLVMVAIALQAYKKKHGSYPDTLNPLVGSCITKLPDDPFALTGTFLYKKSGKSYILYSIGPDTKDDGGRMIDSGIKSSNNSNERYFAKPESNGDIVAGKNKW